jgi:hypothetical protein
METEPPIGPTRDADFSDLVGQWDPDPIFDEIIAAQRQMDWNEWDLNELA